MRLNKKSFINSHIKNLAFSIFLFSILTLNYAGQASYEVALCEKKALIAEIEMQDYCGGLINKDPNSSVRFANCMKTAFETYRQNTCTNSSKAYANNMIFAFNQMSQMFNDVISNKISKSQFDYQNDELRKMISSQFAEHDSSLKNEINQINYDMPESLAKDKSFVFISNFIQILGGNPVNSSIRSTTYNFNGRIINCTTAGVYVNCN